MTMEKDIYTRAWIIANALEEIQNYEKGVLTIRGLHYRLVARGMFNTHQHYKRVVAAMKVARWDSVVDFDVFSDNDREMIGKTHYEKTPVDRSVEDSKWYINYYMNNHRKNRWENQAYHPEVLIEKKALQGVFQSPCKDLDVALGACKGYPSLTFLYDMAIRMKSALDKGKECVVLYFGDHDPSGDDIPRSMEENLRQLGVYDFTFDRIALTKEQAIEWQLPPAPAKKTDSRTKGWDGLGQIELDAVEPSKLRNLCTEAILKYFDEEDYNRLMGQEEAETKVYRAKLLTFIKETYTEE